MKVFGGNGHRIGGKRSPVRKNPNRGAASVGSNYINDDLYGNNRTKAVNEKGNKYQNPQKKGRGILIALLVILAIVGIAFAYLKITTKPPETATSKPSSSGSAAAEPESSPGMTDTATREIGHYYTILIVGEDQVQANTDTIMLARFDAEQNNINIVSIPRDTLVNISGGLKKINNIYFGSKAGIEGLMDEIKDICGFRPDSYVVVDTNVFPKIIDTLGGVYFDVPQDMNYEDDTQNLEIHIKKGYQWLNGDNTLKVFRYRHGYTMGDIDRLKVQHDLIKACASQMLKLGNITKLYEAAKILSGNTETNLSYGNMQWYAQKFMNMSTDSINLMTMPGDYSCSVKGVSYVSINVDEWVSMVNQSLNPLKEEISAKNLNILYKTSAASSGTSASDFAVTNGGKIAGGFGSFRG